MVRSRILAPLLTVALVAVPIAATMAATRVAQPPLTAWTRYHAYPSNNALVTAPARGVVSWRSRVMPDNMRAVSVVGDRVYAIGVGKAHGVYALNRATGALVWMRRLDNVVMSQAIVVGGRVFVGTGNNYLRQDPVRNYRTVLRGTGFNSIDALDAASGRILWRLPLQGEAMPTP